MVRYCEGKSTRTTSKRWASTSWRNHRVGGTEVRFSIWDLGGQREFPSMLPLVCNDAAAILFMFDLSRKSTLTSIKEGTGARAG